MVGIDRFQGFLQVRQGLEGIPKPRQVSWAGRTKGDPCEHALNVANSFQQIVHRLIVEPVQQCRYRLLTLADDLHIPKRPIQPAPEFPSTHGCGGAVHDPGEGILVAAHEIGVNFQIATAGRVEDDCFIAPFTGQLANMGQGGTLGFLGILQQAACGTDGEIEFLAAETRQVPHLKLMGNNPSGGIGFEEPGPLTAYSGETLQNVLVGKILADQDFRRTQALQFALQGLQVFQLRHGKTAAGNIERGKTELLPMVIDSHQ